jgi:hypothetical protein
MKSCIVCLAVFVALLQPITSAASLQLWDSSYANARSMGLGTSDLADLKGPTAVFDNPGLIIEDEGVQMGFDTHDYPAGDMRDFGLSFRKDQVTLLAGVKTFMATQLIRTAYLPDGTGQTYELDDRVYALGLNLNMLPSRGPGDNEVWTMGAALRYSSHEFGDAEYGVGDLDLGTTYRIRRIRSSSLIEFSGAAAMMNVLGNEGATDIGTTDLGTVGGTSELLQTFRVGAALKIGTGLGAFERDGATITGYVDLYRMLNHYYDADITYSFGTEVIFYHALALRAGYDDRGSNHSGSFGLGVILAGDELLTPFDLHIDYCRLDSSIMSYMSSGNMDFWSFNVVWLF